jgi:hypothetical protein
MADAAKTKQPADSTATPPAAKARWWTRLLTRRWFVVFMVISLVVHGIVFVLVRRSIAKPEIPLEYTVGAFNIVAGSNSEPHALAGKFELHVRFIDDL